MRNLLLKGAVWAQSHEQREEGQTAIEYAIVVAAVSLALALALFTFGDGVITAAGTAVDTWVTTNL
ncbi:MAG: hypothetical protein WD557_04410 [Dehalococcoidia bacterium]